LDSENFSSYFDAREIVNREKRKKAFRDFNNEKFEIKLRELLGIHRNDFNNAKPPTLQNDIYFLSNFFKDQSFRKHANAELF